jgi:chaperone modulatory protein CbpM
MVDTTEFSQIAGVEQVVLKAWIDAGWLSPRQDRQDWQFSDLDLVRVRFILDLRGPMGVNEEGIAVILHLVDQIHGLRRALRNATTPPAGAASSHITDLSARRGSAAQHH